MTQLTSNLARAVIHVAHSDSLPTLELSTMGHFGGPLPAQICKDNYGSDQPAYVSNPANKESYGGRPRVAAGRNDMFRPLPVPYYRKFALLLSFDSLGRSRDRYQSRRHPALLPVV